MDQDAHMRRIIDNLSTDLNNLSSECKRKYPPVKEASEACLLKLRQINNLKINLYKTMCDSSSEVIKPLILGCDTKQPKIIQICLTSVQKVVEAKILNVSSASSLINILWILTESGLEELKVLQTIILIVTTTDVVKHNLLAKTLTIGFRLAASKDLIVMNTATAMLSQMVTKVFERVVTESKAVNQQPSSATGTASAASPAPAPARAMDMDQLKTLSKEAPNWLSDSAQDAYMLLQDIYLLLNSDQSLWLMNVNEINKPFGLELLKSILVRYPDIFFMNPEMCFVLKERICPLLIKLFSPSTKLKANSAGAGHQQSSPSNNAANASLIEQLQKNANYFAIVSRLIRIVFVLIKSYFELLVTESEIFLSLLTKFLDMDRPLWQKALAIEVFHKISVETRLIESLVVNYDMKQHPEKIFSLITSGIALFIQSLFLNAATSTTGSSSASGQNNGSSGQSTSSGQSPSSQQLLSGSGLSGGQNSMGGMSMSSSSSIYQQQQQQQQSNAYAFQISSAQPSFIYKDTTIQLLFPYISGQVKATYLDTWDKLDVPYIQDGYLLSVGFATLQELCKTVQTLIEQNLNTYQQQQQQQEQQNSSSEAVSGAASQNMAPINFANKSLKRLTLDPPMAASSPTTSPHLQQCYQLMSSSCNSFLFVYNILLESSLDETITEQIIKTIRSFVYISSLLNMNAQRDAFVTSLCKAALPANYAHYVLNLKSIADLNYLVQQQPPQSVSASQTYYPKSGPPNSRGGGVTTGSRALSTIDDSSERQIQVVAIGPALHVAPQSTSSSTNTTTTTTSPTSTMAAVAAAGNANSSTLLITAKNLLAMKSILNMSQLYSELMGSSWYIILNTIQHLTWTLNLKPNIGSNGQLRHSNAALGGPTASSSSNSVSSSSLASSSGITTTSGVSSGLNASSTSSMISDPSGGGSMITTAIQTEIAFICNMLSKLFETSRNLSDQSLKDIVEALLQLSVECSDLAFLRNEPCLFAVAKLYETSIANLHRIDQFWPQVTMHLLCSCKHTNVKYREWCVDSICNMIRATFNYKYSLGSSTTSPAVLSSLMTNNFAAAAAATASNGMGSMMRHNILQPLHELSAISFNDVRQKQIECTLSILRLMGQHLNESWPVCLNIIGAIQREHTEALIRAAFQCLQLVVTDFLSMIKANYLSLVINVVSKFGSQEQDLNISLTAIVLLWNISDYMFQNSERLNEEIKKSFLENSSATGTGAEKTTPADEEQLSSIKDIESVWMVLYSRLGHLCVDPRPAVRKSAGQTLFCTISSHGSVLGVDSHWKDLVWNVLFPLLEEVRHFTSTASRERDKHANNPNFLMHHSRDTAEKQWAETSVLTLAGVTRVFNSKCWILMKLANNEFHRMWVFLLNIIEMSALSRNSEIALSALRGFHELLGNQNYFSSASSFAGASNSTAQTFAAAASAASVVTAPANQSPTAASSSASTNQQQQQQQQQNCAVNSMFKMFDIVEWLAAWKTWSNIGNSLVNAGSNLQKTNAANANGNNNTTTPTVTAPNNNSISQWPPPTQTFLTCYIDLVPVLVEKLAPVSKFTTSDFDNFSVIIDKLLSVPVLSSDYSSFILMQVDNNLTPLQNTSLNTMKSFVKLLKQVNDTTADFQKDFIPLVFERLLSFVLYACYNSNPLFTAVNAANGASQMMNGGEHKSSSSTSTFMGAKPSEVVTINFVPFGEKSLLMATSLYEEWANHEVVIESGILRTIIQTLYVPMSLKYSCPSPTTWKLSVECLFAILKRALPIAFKNRPHFETMWLDLAKTFEDFLFTKNVALEDSPMEVTRKDELIDCQIIELIRDKILAQSNHLPQQFIQKILAILNRGSIYSNPFENVIDLDMARSHREDFSKTCFEALLRFSFINSNESGGNGNGNGNGNVPVLNGQNGGGESSSNEGNLTRMALSSMLARCKEIIQRYTNDEKTNGRVPLPRPRINEMICVLRALCTLINALKKAPKESIQSPIWNQVIGLYPCLVECTSSPTPQIIDSIKDTLHHYFSLLRAPQ